MTPKILIIEDDVQISEIVAYNLEKEGFICETAVNGEAGLELLKKEPAELILLDIMLPGMSGYDLCRLVRKTSSVPIVMLTARESEDDRIEGLEAGADDYIVKPFSMREMILRVKANLRRQSGETSAQPGDAGPFSFDERRQEACLNGKRVDLSARELELLRFLVTTPEYIHTREELLEKIWGYQYLGGTRVVDVAIRRLREKLEECADGGKNYIATKHGAGYFFDPSANED